MDETDFRVAGADHKLLDNLYRESTFGLSEFSEVLERRFPRRTNLQCLEVGSGSGLLLARMMDRYPGCCWEGLEPMGQGFAPVASLLEQTRASHRLVVHDTALEDFDTQSRFDFIFSLNVLEHVDSWRDCLARIHALLRPGGVAVVLCPNYSFPYEPHYALPILCTKDLTRRVFQSRIARHDDRHHTDGLWSSLNFIKKREVIAFCRDRGIRFSFDEAIMTRMVEKLWTDPRFAERQGAMAGPAKLLHRLGVTRVVERFPFNRLSPYQKLVLER